MFPSSDGKTVDEGMELWEGKSNEDWSGQVTKFIFFLDLYMPVLSTSDQLQALTICFLMYMSIYLFVQLASVKRDLENKFKSLNQKIDKLLQVPGGKLEC